MPDSQTPPPGPLWRIEATKYDHRLHYTLPVYLLHDDGTRLVFRQQIGGQIEHFSRDQSFPITRRSDMFFWRGRWYNVYLNFDEAGNLRHYYCNVGLPPTITGRTLAFIDLDLDVCIWPDGRYEVMDEDEFADHAVQMAYPADVQCRARQTVEEILAMWRAHTPPFDFHLPS